ncbi:MAG: glycosyltransferase family 2 protein, partial [Candidatus Omnitrophica bacterium]|nr:glycosyltransferase family 2 protein [Candidatus Omnitrophota bacterium]
KGWADEIIVCDDGSTDTTVKIAQSYGAKVVLNPNVTIEGAKRNWAYSNAKNDWVFSIDADEIVTEPIKKEIDTVLPDTEHTCFSVPNKVYIGNYWIRWGGWYPSAKVKLFRKSKFKYEESDVHPRIFTEGSCGHLKKDILHYSYRDWFDFLDKTNKQTTLEAKKWYRVFNEDPKKAKKKMNFLHALWRTFDRFVRAYIFKKGYKDGFTGFVLAYYGSLYQLTSYAKYRELIEKSAG